MPVIPPRAANPTLQSLPQRLTSLFDMVAPCPQEWFSGNGKAHGTHARRVATSHGGELEPIPCSTFAEVISAWGAAMRLRASMDDVLSVMLAVCISTEQVGDQLFLKVIGDAGCLHRDTPIHDPTDGSTKTVEERWQERKVFHVWSRLPSGQVAVMPAKPPTIFPVEDIYRVTFSSGREVKVTAGHRFWSGDGYISVREVQRALRESGACRLPSISESVLLTQMQDAHRWTQTTEGYQANCSAYSYPCGEQTLEGLSTYQVASLLPGDALAHSRLSLRRDALDAIGTRNHPYQSLSHLSKLDYQGLASTPYGCEASYQTCERTLQRSLACNLLDERPPILTAQTRKAGESWQFSFGSVFEDEYQSGYFALSKYAQTQGILQRSLPWRLPNDLVGKSLASCQWSLESERPACDISVEGMGYTAYTLPKWDDVVKVELCGRDNYFDFHVPYTENYWAEGVFHHNSGKTRFCEGLLVSKSCYPLEHLTGFHSGWKGGSENGQDFSLLSRINRKTLITPEGDVLVSSPQFQQIMSQQRRIFDGTSGADYKNMSEQQRHTGLRTPWIIAGTPALLDADQSRLGDRFLKVYVDAPDDEEKKHILRMVGRSALQAVRLKSEQDNAEKQMSPEMAYAYQLTGGYVDWLKMNTDLLSTIDMSDDHLDRCAVLADFTASMRASQPKENHPTVELPTRLNHQMVRLACCNAVVLNKSEVDSEVMRRIRKVAVDTSRGPNLDIVRVLAKCQYGAEIRVLVNGIHITEDRCRSMMRFLTHIGVVTRYTGPLPGGVKATGPRWMLTGKMKALYNEVQP